MIRYDFMRVLSFVLLTLFLLTTVSCGAGGSREVVFRANGEYIQWRYTDSSEWNDLLSLSDLEGCDKFRGYSAYEIALSQGFIGTEEEWINSLKGSSGSDGESVYIGENGNWWIGGVDTGVSAYGSGNDGFYAVPEFIGKSIGDISKSEDNKRFKIIFEEGAKEGDIIKYQSVTAGIIATAGTVIKLYTSDIKIIYPDNETESVGGEILSENEDGTADEGQSEYITESENEDNTETIIDDASEKVTEDLTESNTEEVELLPCDITMINCNTSAHGASLTVKGTSGERYDILAVSKDNGKIIYSSFGYADENGLVTWEWSMTFSSGVYTAEITVTNGDGKHKSLNLNL